MVVGFVAEAERSSGGSVMQDQEGECPRGGGVFPPYSLVSM